jgi:WD40 repeat protein
MMICANKNEFFVWDESDDENGSKMLRRVSNGHIEDITILEYDHHLSLIATGCINGEITLYDFELSKVEGVLKGHTGDITVLKFLSPNPLLISTSMDKSMCIWAVRPCP